MLIESLKMIPLAGMSATCRRSSAARATNASPPPIPNGPEDGGPGMEERKGSASPASSFMEALACRASGGLLVVVGLFCFFWDPPGRKIWRTACIVFWLIMWIPCVRETDRIDRPWASRQNTR